MTNTSTVGSVALEFWRASGARTIERLDYLFGMYADTYLLAGEAREEAFRAMRAKVRDWEVSK